MSQLQLDRDYTNAAPVALLPGMLHAELSNFTKLWIGSPTGNRLILSDDPANVPSNMNNYLPLTGGTMQGPLTLPANANAPLQAVPLQQLNAAIAGVPLANYLPLAGGSMTGSLSVLNPPTQPTEATPKTYVDSQIAAAVASIPLGNYLPLTGGTLTGSLSMNAPTLAINASAFDWATISLSRSNGNSNQVIGTTNGSARWSIVLGNGTSETGGNAGSNFAISRFGDGGNYLDAPIFIDRATGTVDIAGTLTSNYFYSAAGAQISNGLTVDYFHDTGSANIDGNLNANSNVGVAGSVTTAYLAAGGAGISGSLTAVSMYPSFNAAPAFYLLSDGYSNILNWQGGYAFSWDVATGLLNQIANNVVVEQTLWDGTKNFLGPVATFNYPPTGVGTLRLGNSGVAQIGGDPAGEVFLNSASNSLTLASQGLGLGNGNFWVNNGGVLVGGDITSNNGIYGQYIQSNGAGRTAGDHTVGGTLYVNSNITSNTGGVYLWTSGGTGFTFADNGATLSWNLYLGGGYGHQPNGGLWVDISDARIKHNVVDYTAGLSQVLRLRPKTFSFVPETGRDPDVRYVGLIAQDVAPVLPETVSLTPATHPQLGSVTIDDLLSFNGTPVIYALINAVQELAARITAQEAR
jgi:Chaperone of endosialidase